MDTRNPHDLTVEEFDNLYESAIGIADGSTPERNRPRRRKESAP